MIVKINGEAHIVGWKHLDEDAVKASGLKFPAGDLADSATVCEIFTWFNNPQGERLRVVTALGITFCSKKDSYCKDTGRKKSLTRALTNGLFGPADRKVFWETYLSENHGSPVKKEEN